MLLYIFTSKVLFDVLSKDMGHVAMLLLCNRRAGKNAKLIQNYAFFGPYSTLKKNAKNARACPEALHEPYCSQKNAFSVRIWVLKKTQKRPRLPCAIAQSSRRNVF